MKRSPVEHPIIERLEPVGMHTLIPTISILVVSAISGAAALVYEVLWLRLLTLWLGHGTAAAGTVLAAFMGGLAAGAWLGGRLATVLSPRRALQTYAGLEITIALGALALPAAFALVHPLLGSTYANGDGGLTFTLTRTAVSLLLVSIPALAMGATYPLAVRWFTASSQLPPLAYRRSTRPPHPRGAATGPIGEQDTTDAAARTAQRAGRIYATNTAGAAGGVALAGFVLLPLLGMDGTTIVAIGLNALAAAGACLLAAYETDGPSSLDHDQQTSSPSDTDRSRLAFLARGRTPPRDSYLGGRTERRLAGSALAVSGFVALVYEVIWTRILAMVLGPTAYSFSSMLLAFITGLAIGGVRASALRARTRHPGTWLGVMLVVAAAAALGAALVVDRLPLVMAAAVTSPGAGFASVLQLQVALGIGVQLPMTVALGAAFPLALAHAAPAADDAPRSAARLYTANTAGAIAGAVAASFYLVPVLGLQTALRLTVALTMAAGLVVCMATTPRRGRFAVAAAALALLGPLLLPQWNRELLANGGYRYASSSGDVTTALEAGRLLFYRDGAAGTVSVRQLPGVRSMAIDGKVDASNAEDMLTQRLLAHLPLLLHERPRDVLVIGLGSGVTTGSALRHPVERVDVVEISPEVVEASAYFETENSHALADPRTRLIVGDGRSHLLLGSRQYDVIISEPSNPWMAGVASLFTREFFAAARDRLVPGGILCQWAHTYNISDADLRSIAATFLDTFPNGSAWLVGESDLLLIGSHEPIAALERGVETAWDRPGVAADLSGVSVHDAYSLLTLFVAQGVDLQRYANGGVIQTDAALSLEYSAPRAIYGRYQEANVNALRAIEVTARRPPAVRLVETAPSAAQRRNRGIMRLRANAGAAAYEDFSAAIRHSPRDEDALDGLVRAAARANTLNEAEQVLREVAAATRSAPALVALSRLLAMSGRSDEATNTARDAALIEPGNAAVLHQLSVMYADRGDQDALSQLARIVEPSPAHRTVALYCAARLALLRGDLPTAARAASDLVSLKRDAETLTLLGVIRTDMGQFAGAREAFEASLALAPRDAVVLAKLGLVELRSGNTASAVERFSEALFVQPTYAPALTGLSQASGVAQSNVLEMTDPR